MRFASRKNRAEFLFGISFTEGIQADYTDGVLTLQLPKRAVTMPASRRIEIR